MAKPPFLPLVTAIAIVIVTSACASNDEKPTMTHYVLDVKNPEARVVPLPDSYAIHIRKFMSDGSEIETLGFRGWDFDDDQRFEMVEVLDNKGKAVAYVYDFDGDGKLDLTERVGEIINPLVDAPVPATAPGSGGNDNAKD